MSANTQSWVLSIGLFLLPLAIAGCGVPVYEPLGGDDDDIFGGDDDDATSDDDDDATGDDDTGDDDSVPGDLDAVTIPEFSDCTGNQVKFVLGDGTELGPVSGFDATASYANHTGVFKIQVGSPTLWAGILGHQGEMQAGSPVIFQAPAELPGNAVLQGFVSVSDIGTSDPGMAVGYGMAASGLDERVGGEVTFDVVPAPGQQTSGSFSGIGQWWVGPLTPRVILLGVAGCFSATLEATDTGG